MIAGTASFATCRKTRTTVSGPAPSSQLHAGTPSTSPSGTTACCCPRIGGEAEHVRWQRLLLVGVVSLGPLVQGRASVMHT
eukprot:1752163-Alexandrium_andersonii.AAC.1